MIDKSFNFDLSGLDNLLDGLAKLDYLGDSRIYMQDEED